MPIAEWADKENMVHTHNGLLLGHEEGDPAIRNSTDGPEGIMLWNKSDREWPHSYVESKKQTKNSRIQSTDWWLPGREELGGGMGKGGLKTPTSSVK